MLMSMKKDCAGDDAAFEKILLFVHRAVNLACTVVLTLFVHTEIVPVCRTEDLLLGNVVKRNGNTKH